MFSVEFCPNRTFKRQGKTKLFCCCCLSFLNLLTVNKKYFRVQKYFFFLSYQWEAPIIHKFEVVEGSDDVPQCALECRPKDKINPKLVNKYFLCNAILFFSSLECLYQFFAMVKKIQSSFIFQKGKFREVDDKFSTIAIGKNETCFHVVFKPDDWDQVKSKKLFFPFFLSEI